MLTKSIKTLLATFLVALLPTCVLAGVWNPENLEMVHLQDRNRYVCNPDGVLSNAAVHYCDSLIRILEDQIGVQFVVVAVEHIEGDDPYEFNKNLFLKYKFGQADKDNGLLLTLASLDRSFFYSTGKGMEGVLPDALLKRMENAYFVPRLKAGDWDGGIRDMVTLTFNYLLGNDTTRAEVESQVDAKISSLKSSSESSSSDDSGAVEAIFMTIVAGVIIFFAARQSKRDRRRTCPHCRAKHSMDKVSEKRVEGDDIVNVLQVWTCSKCGWSMPDSFSYDPTEYSSSSYDDDDDYDSSSSSDNDSGGSFGGGSYGGGGAGGRF